MKNHKPDPIRSTVWNKIRTSVYLIILMLILCYIYTKLLNNAKIDTTGNSKKLSRLNFLRFQNYSFSNYRSNNSYPITSADIDGSKFLLKFDYHPVESIVNFAHQVDQLLRLKNKNHDRVPEIIRKKFNLSIEPVKGIIPTNATVPLFGMSHEEKHDAVFALACNYPKLFYKRFVGTLRKTGFTGDIVLAVSPEIKMKAGVYDYLQSMEVIAYPFEVDCDGIDNCKLKDEFLGYPDPRPHRPFANIRYALYEHWLRFYSSHSYILILDFRDTFFQSDPFASFGRIEERQEVKYDLQLFAENHKVKSIGSCVFNSMWISICFGKTALRSIEKQAVICSGSTLGSYPAIHHYLRTMLQSMDSVQCCKRGIESDQGYQNYLHYNGYFNTEHGNATLFYQGTGIVNTIGAMNGFRVLKKDRINRQKLLSNATATTFFNESTAYSNEVLMNNTGPLDTFWHSRDAEGYIINYDGTRSPCVHQWDRWYKALRKFLDTKL